MFAEALRDKMAEEGIVVSGQLPNTEVARFEIKLNAGKRTASISYRNELLRRVAQTLEQLVRDEKLRRPAGDGCFGLLLAASD